MPIAKVQLPDGRIARFEVPEGTTPDQVTQFANSNFQSAEPKAPEPEKHSPLSGVSDLETFAAGAGKAVNDAWRGFRQIVAPVGFGSSVGSSVGPGVPLGLGSFKPSAEKIQAEVEESRRLDKDLTDSGAGMAGNIAGNVAMTIPALAVPGVNTYAGAGLMGGLMGLAQPTVEGESRALNTALGAGAGVLGQGVGNLIGGISKSAANKVSQIESDVAERSAKQAASETASARSAAGTSAQDAYRQLEHLRELNAMGSLTPEQALVASQLEKELAGKASEKLLPAAARKESTAKAFQEAMETEADRASKLTAEKLSNKEVKSQIAARLKRYGPAAAGGMIGNMLLPGMGGAIGGAATGLVLRPAIRSMANLLKNPAVQRKALMPIANSTTANNPNLPLIMALMGSSVNAGEQ